MAKNTEKNAKPYNRAARSKYTLEHRATVAVCLPKETVVLFKELCRANGTTPNAELRNFILNFIDQQT